MVDIWPAAKRGPTVSRSHFKKHPPPHYGRILNKFFDVSSWAFFSIDISPLSLKEIQGLSVTGCLVITNLHSQGNKALQTVRISMLIRSSWRKILSGLSSDQKKELSNEMHNLLYYESDSLIETQEALEKILKSADVWIAGADEACWLHSHVLQPFALLRRMAMPMHHMETGSIESHILADCSLIDLLLDMPEVCTVVSRSLNGRLHDIEMCIDNTQDGNTVAQLRQLHRMTSNALQRAGFSVNPIQRKCLIQTYVVPDKVEQEHTAVIQERNRLLRELKLRKENPDIAPSHTTMNGVVELPQRIYGGTVLVTDMEMSFDVFQAQTHLMEMVNRKLKRPYLPGVSRPRLSAVSMPLEGLNELRSIFFDEFGALNKDIIGDIDRSPRHSFILFSNHVNERGDLRWQLPLRRHSKNDVVHTRRRVEKLLARYGYIDENRETLHDLAMLMGGTEDQSLHHDIPRQTTTFLPYDPEDQQKIMAQVPSVLVAASGWEFDRAAYNDAMSSPQAPASILLGMGDEFKVMVGVQRNQVDQRGCDVGWCRIIDGRNDEIFRIVRECEHVITIEGTPGVSFTGDFQHAGVRNFSRGTPEDSLMDRLFDRILEATATTSDDSTEKVIKMMCTFSGLNRICRFHCSTEPVEGPLVIPRNAVGFVDCKKNPPSSLSHLQRARQPRNQKEAPIVDVAEQSPELCRPGADCVR